MHTETPAPTKRRDGAADAQQRSIDTDLMKQAIVLAECARTEGEVPVGAVVVDGEGRVIGRGHNAPISQHDPTAHAEIAALRQACAALGNYRLDGCTLYVTLEPCAMCSGAMLHARLARVVFGAHEPRTGAAGSVIDLFAQARLNHQTSVTGGVLAAQCAALLQSFFDARRDRQRELRATNMAHVPLVQWALRTPGNLAHRLAEPPEEGADAFRADLPALDGLRLHARVLEPTAGSGFAERHGSPERKRLSAWLCLHGARTWSWRFEALAQALAGAGERGLLIDLPGFGRSDKPKREDFHTLERHVNVIEEWLDRLGIGPVVIVGPDDDAHVPRLIANALRPRVMALALVPAPHDISRDAQPYPDAGHRAGPRALARWAAPAGAAQAEQGGVGERAAAELPVFKLEGDDPAGSALSLASALSALRGPGA